MDEELKNTDYGKYTPKYLEGREGFMYNEVERVEQSDENYRVTFRYTLFTPGVIVPVKLGFKPEKGMKVIYDSEDHIGASAMLGFYNEKGDCLFMGERTFSFKEGRMKPEWKAILNTQDKENDTVKNAMERVKKAQDWLKETRDTYKSILRFGDSMKEDSLTYELFRDSIAYQKDLNEENYKKVNPELAALREEERAKVEKGMDPKQAQKERREAVKDYYNKKSQRGK